MIYSIDNMRGPYQLSRDVLRNTSALRILRKFKIRVFLFLYHNLTFDDARKKDGKIPALPV